MVGDPMIWHPSWAQLDVAADLCARHVQRSGWHPNGVFGVPRGGCTPAAMVAARLTLPLVDAPDRFTLVVDDLIDSGATAARYPQQGFVALFRKSWSTRSPLVYAAHGVPGDAWVVFPWETNDDAPAADAVLRLAQAAGLDTSELAGEAARIAPRAAELVAQLLGRAPSPTS